MDATYCCGDSLTLADFYVYGLLNWIGMNTLDGVPHTIILECSSASFDTLRASRRWRSVEKTPPRATANSRAAHEAQTLVVTLNNHPKI